MNLQNQKILSLGFWYAYWITMRPYLTFVSGAAGLVGLAHIPEQSNLRTIIAFIPLFFSYGFGQALTDCFQMDTDAISSPYRPLVRGLISKRQVLIVSLAGLVVSAVIMMLLNPPVILLGILATLGLLTYTKLKRTWWGGPPWNSWIIALLPIMGVLVDKDMTTSKYFQLFGLHAASFLFCVLAIFFAYANFVLIGYFKDISADKQTGYNTFPVTFGWKPAAIASDLLAILAALMSGMSIIGLGRENSFGLAVWVCAVVLNGYAQVKIHLTRQEKKAFGPITNIVRVFVLYCLSIILTLKFNWLGPMVIFYVLFELSLKIRPEKTQV
jgi:4-hydroxybenzoate polyprenyltransferase